MVIYLHHVHLGRNQAAIF
jgi:hypothetical protein